MEISKPECMRILRTLELKAYRSVVDALRAQGALTSNKHEVLKNLATALKVSEERYRSEMRRAANDDLLNTVAQYTSGENTEAEWRTESMKKVPFTPMIASQNAFTALADTISDMVALENEKLSNSIESNNVIESYKSRGEENLEKYSSSKVLSSLLQKRKNHHEDSILSELEKIKSNNNYFRSPVKSGYIEVSYDESPNIVEAPVRSIGQKTVSWKSDDDVYPLEDANSPPKSILSKHSRKSDLKSQLKPSTDRIENIELLPESHAKEKTSRQKLKSKNKISRKPSPEDDLPTNLLKQQNTVKTRNLRTKPFKKYTLNSVEIQTFEEDIPTEKFTKPKTVRNKPANDVNKSNYKTDPLQESSNPNLSQMQVTCDEKNTVKVPKNRKTKRRSRGRTKPVRKSKIAQVRKLVSSQRKKSDSVKEAPVKTSRISMRNARRRNYARMASGDYDLPEFKTPSKEKKIEVDEIKKEEKEEEIEATDPEILSDNSNAPIEVSYSNLVPPKSSNYELENVSAHFSEDDMRPHTFNLIPASRRLKMLKKRAKSPLKDEVPAKKAALIPKSESEQDVVVTKSSNDINALRKVLAAHENIENVTTCNASDLPENVKELLNISDRPQSSLLPRPHDSFTSTATHSSSAPEKHTTKPKMKLAEASTLENLHSLLSKVKEGDLKRLSKSASSIKKPLMKRKEITKKKLTRPTPSIEKGHNGNLIEVNNLDYGSDVSSFGDENNDAPSKESDSEDHIMIENNEEPVKIAPPQNIEERKNTSHSANDEEVVNITIDDVEDMTESDISEQLIDIESADIIISDNGDQNGDFTIVDDDTTILASELKAGDDKKSFKDVKLLEPTAAATNHDETKLSKDDIIVINVDKSEDIKTGVNSPTTDETKDAKIRTSNHAKAPTNVKDLLTAASDFRYIADADDPSLKNPSVPLLPKNAFIIPKPTGAKAFSETGKLTAISSVKPIVLNSLESISTTAASPKVGQNIILTNSSLNTKERPFILLGTKSTLGSKSLLKSVKALPKIVPVYNHSANNANDNVQKPKKLAIYSSLKNINLATISSFSKSTPIKTTHVTSILKPDESSNANATITKNNDIHGNLKSSSSEDDKNSKRVVFSKALENSLKCIEPSKDAEKSDKKSLKTSEEPRLPNDFDKMIEISSQELQAEKSDSDITLESPMTDMNKLKTFFSKNIIRKSS